MEPFVFKVMTGLQEYSDRCDKSFPGALPIPRDENEAILHDFALSMRRFRDAKVQDWYAYLQTEGRTVAMRLKLLMLEETMLQRQGVLLRLAAGGAQ